MRMTDKTKQRLRKTYTVVLCCAIVAAAVALAGGCLYLFFTGDAQPFTPERVKTVFSKVGWLLYLCLALVIGSFFLPQTAKQKPGREKMTISHPKSRKTIRTVRVACLLVGVVAVVLGVCFDGVQAVIANAIALCMSCIGLG